MLLHFLLPGSRRYNRTPARSVSLAGRPPLTAVSAPLRPRTTPTRSPPVAGSLVQGRSVSFGGLGLKIGVPKVPFPSHMERYSEGGKFTSSFAQACG
jgi:hypothetical protein